MGKQSSWLQSHRNENCDVAHWLGPLSSWRISESAEALFQLGLRLGHWRRKTLAILDPHRRYRSLISLDNLQRFLFRRLQRYCTLVRHQPRDVSGSGPHNEASIFGAKRSSIGLALGLWRNEFYSHSVTSNRFQSNPKHWLHICLSNVGKSFTKRVEISRSQSVYPGSICTSSPRTYRIF